MVEMIILAYDIINASNLDLLRLIVGVRLLCVNFRYLIDIISTPKEEMTASERYCMKASMEYTVTPLRDQI